MINFSVQGDVNQILSHLKGLEDVGKRAAATAINRIAVSAQSVALKAISQETGLTQRSVREKMKLRRAMPDRLLAEIVAESFAPNLIRFGARQVKAGVSANAWRKRKTYKGAFIGNQGRTVFTRMGKARLPIKALHGPSVRKTFMRQHVQAALDRVVAERWPTEIQHQLAFYMSRVRA